MSTDPPPDLSQRVSYLTLGDTGSMSKITIPKELRLTPALKAVIEGAIKLVEKGHIQNAFMKDAQTGQVYGHGWETNGKKPLVCAVGGLQRAAWIALGKPDMTEQTNVYEVENLADLAQARVELFLPHSQVVSAAHYKTAIQAYKEDLDAYKTDPSYFLCKPILDDYLYETCTIDDVIDYNDAPEALVTLKGEKVEAPKKRVVSLFKKALGQ